MKNSRFFIVASAVALGVVSIFATKPDKKFTFFNVEFDHGSISGTFQVDDGIFTTTSTNNKLVQLKTIDGTVISTLFTSIPNGSEVYRK